MPKTQDTIIALNDLKREIDFDLSPGAEDRTKIAEDLDFQGIRKLRFEGKLVPDGKSDWVLTARLGATIIQSCVVTLDPVTTRIDTDIRRAYRADFKDPDTANEVEMPEDDTEEALPATLNLADVMIEALSIAAPDFPRADGVELENTTFAAPGVAPLSDDDVKPFAGLQALKEKMDKKDSE